MIANVKILVVCFSFLLIASLSAQNRKIEASKSKVSFKIKNSGLTVNGTLTGISGTIVFDPKSPSTSSFNIKVDVSTINTGINARDNHLKKEEYFDASKYPYIQFVSKQITAVSGGFEVKGTLTVKGKSKDISFKFTFKEFQSTSAFEGSFDINRLDYGVGTSSWVLSDNAAVSVYVLVNN